MAGQEVPKNVQVSAKFFSVFFLFLKQCCRQCFPMVWNGHASCSEMPVLCSEDACAVLAKAAPATCPSQVCGLPPVGRD